MDSPSRLSASRAWIVEVIGQNHPFVSCIVSKDAKDQKKTLAQSNKATLSTQTLAEMTLKPCNISQSKRYHLILPTVGHEKQHIKND